MATPTANWKSFQLQLPGQDLLEGARNILETLVLYLEILKTLLDTIKSLLIAFGNPIIALVEALITLINTLFNTLKQTGLYAWFDIPDPTVDPNFNRHVGGFPSFVTRFKGGLVDVRDPNRPQPVAGATQSGFLLLVVDAEAVEGLVRLATLLLRFFGKEFLAPHYAAPSNVKVLPVGSNGDPVLSIAAVFQKQPKSLVVEWSLPTTQHVGDPGFSDVFSSFATEFIPPKFVIEKSAINPNVEIDAANLINGDSAGIITKVVNTNFEVRGAPGQIVQRKIRLPDFYNDPFIKFQKYIVVDPTHATATFILGQLGTFRYIDNDVKPGVTYWYRVRAYSGNLTVESDNTITQFSVERNAVDGHYYIQWPGDTPVMGRASPISAQRLPIYPTGSTFDVLANLQRLFQLAFSLNFHLELPPGASFNAQGLPANPATTLPTDVGKGSLTQQAGSLVSFTAVPILGSSSGFGSQSFVADPATGAYPQAPWQAFSVTSNATRLANVVGGAMLGANNAQTFQQFMTGPLPKPSPTTPGLTGLSISGLCFALTNPSSDVNTLRTSLTLYGNAFADTGLRLNILAAINQIKTFTLGGAPPDWITISILRDIVPWSGQLLYDLLAKIQALLNGYQGITAEVIAFINLIERKINTLESFIEYLVSLLDFVIGLDVGFFELFVPQSGGDVTDWFQAIDQAGGTPPPSGPGGYTAGIAIAYVATDVAAFVSALKLIF